MATCKRLIFDLAEMSVKEVGLNFVEIAHLMTACLNNITLVAVLNIYF